jgi:hypothetical protein
VFPLVTTAAATATAHPAPGRSKRVVAPTLREATRSGPLRVLDPPRGVGPDPVRGGRFARRRLVYAPRSRPCRTNGGARAEREMPALAPDEGSLAALEENAALTDAHVERHERVGRGDDATEERRRLGALVRLRGGLVRISWNGSNYPRVGSHRPMGGTVSQAGQAVALDDGVSVPAVGAAGSSMSSLVRRLLSSGGSVSSPVMASGLGVRDRSAGRRRASTTAPPTTCSSLLISRERLRPSSMPVSGLRPDVSPNAARRRSRRGAARWASIPFCEEGNASRVRGFSRPSARLRTWAVL